MQKAGYENGMYDGPPLLTIADNESPAKETAEAFQEQVPRRSASSCSSARSRTRRC